MGKTRSSQHTNKTPLSNTPPTRFAAMPNIDPPPPPPQDLRKKPNSQTTTDGKNDSVFNPGHDTAVNRQRVGSASKKKNKSKNKKKTKVSSEPKGKHDIVTPSSPTNTRNNSKQSTHKKLNDAFWSETSIGEERRRIREFWLELGEEERRSLHKVEKEAVLLQMKELQKHSCNCSVCVSKKRAIKDEVEVLYDTYYDDLEQYANHEQHALECRDTDPTGFPSSNGIELQDLQDDEDYEDEDDERESLSDHSDMPSDAEIDAFESFASYSPSARVKQEHVSRSYESSRRDHLGFGNNLAVKGSPLTPRSGSAKDGTLGGILTVADDILKNHGKRFLDMMERLAERRIQKEGQRADLIDELGEEEESDEQRMEDGRRIFQMLAAQMFEQRVLAAYREKVAQERQQRLLEEFEEEERLEKEKERQKQLENAERKEKALQLKQKNKEERLAKEAQRQAEEEAARAEKKRRAEMESKRREEERRKKEEQQRKIQEEQLKKEEERLRQLKLENDRIVEKERKAKEEKEKKEREEKSRKEREEKKVREKKEQEERIRRAQEEQKERDRLARQQEEQERQLQERRNKEAREQKQKELQLLREQKQRQEDMANAILCETPNAGDHRNGLHIPSALSLSNARGLTPPLMSSPSEARNDMFLPLEEARPNTFLDALGRPSQALSPEALGHAPSTMMSRYAPQATEAAPISPQALLHHGLRPQDTQHDLSISSPMTISGHQSHVRDLQDMASPLSGSLLAMNYSRGPADLEPYPSLGPIGRPVVPSGQPSCNQRIPSSAGLIGSPVAIRLANTASPESNAPKHPSPLENSLFSTFPFRDPPPLMKRPDLYSHRPHAHTTPTMPEHDPFAPHYRADTSPSRHGTHDHTGLNWVNGWTASSVLSERVHDKLFGDALPDPHAAILERMRVAYQKLEELHGPCPFYTLIDLCRMMNDMYHDSVMDVRELHEALVSPQSGFQYLNDSQHGVLVRYGPNRAPPILGMMNETTPRTHMNPALSIPNHTLSPPFVPRSSPSSTPFTPSLHPPSSYPSAMTSTAASPNSPIRLYQLPKMKNTHPAMFGSMS